MFQLTDDERVELRSSARRMLTERSSSDHVRALLDDQVGFDRSLWAAMAELGWPAIHVAEAAGGTGASFADLAVVLHELGRQLTPSPMLASAVLGAAALASAPDGSPPRALLPAVASGDHLLAVALANTAGSYEPDQLSVWWTPSPEGIVLEGASRFAPDAQVADGIVVAARDGAGMVTLAIVDPTARGVSIEVEPVYDRTRRLSLVRLDRVTVGHDALLGEPGQDVDRYRRLVAQGAIAVMCDAVGAAERILEISTEYAKERIQFKRPIGSFQAVKHHLANMFTDVEASRAAVTYAVDVLDSAGDLVHAAAVASSFAGPACVRVAATAVQVHGGIGFTWEHDAHLFLKRLRLDEALFGTAKWHRGHLAVALIDGGSVG